ncbi:hypothetical protein A5700_12555 [Mycobacterium sp. E1214]|uniref:hypothetical protein n=1 Tax=Mycobacterium sp. E1214 TaxID=1834123 RepID=UPI0007FFA48D|nr:hypothetical protein [Mycobacterium sp. E1214]OBG71166.1 hypothetical protein A5700_12555 [Mycobacterium sp. E1214]
MHRHLSLALAATAAVAAVGLAACSSHHKDRAAPPASVVPPVTSGQFTAAPTAPPPAPEALTEVLGRLADPSIPGSSKVNLVEGATPESAGSLDKFTNALRDNGYLPMTFTANDVGWSDKNPADVKATIVVHTAQANNANFTFPMLFTPFQGGWQLSRQTAETLLSLGQSPPANPSPPPPR